MEAITQTKHQKIREDMTKIQIELDKTLQAILQQAGNKIQPEKQADVEQKMVGTQQLLERLKDRYV